MTTQDIIDSLNDYPKEPPLPAPAYQPREGSRAALMVPSMERHMSNEGWQLALALQAGGYKLHGRDLGLGTDVAEILAKDNPAVVFVQDQHEWNSGHLAHRSEFFNNSELLAQRPDVFKLTVMKDTHRQYESNKRYSQGVGCNAWITYYSVPITLHTLSWLRPQHVIRTYHTVDSEMVPRYDPNARRPCLLSGSLGGAYPLRERVHKANLPNVDYLKHPGYGNHGTSTNAYLYELSRFKVAICTASKFGYALRKIIEATACGCKVVTDLPVDEVLPDIDGNLVRVEPNIPMHEFHQLVLRLAEDYDADAQEYWAKWAKSRYDYHLEGVRLAGEIEKVRSSYSD